MLYICGSLRTSGNFIFGWLLIAALAVIVNRLLGYWLLPKAQQQNRSIVVIFVWALLIVLAFWLVIYAITPEAHSGLFSSLHFPVLGVE